MMNDPKPIFEEIDVPADGNCFYYAVWMGLIDGILAGRIKLEENNALTALLISLFNQKDLKNNRTLTQEITDQRKKFYNIKDGLIPRDTPDLPLHLQLIALLKQYQSNLYGLFKDILAPHLRQAIAEKANNEKTNVIHSATVSSINEAINLINQNEKSNFTYETYISQIPKDRFYGGNVEEIILKDCFDIEVKHFDPKNIPTRHDDNTLWIRNTGNHFHAGLLNSPPVEDADEDKEILKDIFEKREQLKKLIDDYKKKLKEDVEQAFDSDAFLKKINGWRTGWDLQGTDKQLYPLLDIINEAEAMLESKDLSKKVAASEALTILSQALRKKTSSESPQYLELINNLLEKFTPKEKEKEETVVLSPLHQTEFNNNLSSPPAEDPRILPNADGGPSFQSISLDGLSTTSTKIDPALETHQQETNTPESSLFNLSPLTIESKAHDLGYLESLNESTSPRSSIVSEPSGYLSPGKVDSNMKKYNDDASLISEFTSSLSTSPTDPLADVNISDENESSLSSSSLTSPETTSNDSKKNLAPLALSEEYGNPARKEKNPEKSAETLKSPSMVNPQKENVIEEKEEENDDEDKDDTSRISDVTKDSSRPISRAGSVNSASGTLYYNRGPNLSSINLEPVVHNHFFLTLDDLFDSDKKPAKATSLNNLKITLDGQIKRLNGFMKAMHTRQDKKINISLALLGDTLKEYPVSQHALKLKFYEALHQAIIEIETMGKRYQQKFTQIQFSRAIFYAFRVVESYITERKPPQKNIAHILNYTGSNNPTMDQGIAEDNITQIAMALYQSSKHMPAIFDKIGQIFETKPRLSSNIASDIQEYKAVEEYNEMKTSSPLSSFSP